MFYTEEEVSVITGLLNAYLVREHASEKVRESYTYWWSDREDGRMLMDALLHTQTLARRT